MVALIAFAGAGAWLPGTAGAAVFGTWAFRVVAALLCASLVASLWERLSGVAEAKVLGLWLLHFGIVAVAGAGLWNWLGSSEHAVELVEGEALGIGGTGVSMALDRLDPDRREGRWRKGDAAEVTMLGMGKERRREVIHVNRPLNVGDHWVFLGIHGFAPVVASGEQAAVVRLNTAFKPAIRYWGEFEVPGTPGRFTAVFRPAPEGHMVRDPSLKIVARRPDGRTRWAAVARPGRPAVVDGLTLSLIGVRYWASFTVTHEPGLRMVFASFWIAIAGAALTLLPRVLRGGV
jgi:hypothetical protein